MSADSLRIAFVAAGGFDESGRERVTPTLLSFVECLARRHRVTVYVLRYLREPRTYALAGATVRDLGWPRGIGGAYSALVDALRRDGDCDVVHGYLALPAGLVASAAARRLRVPSVVTFDSSELTALPDIRYGLQRTLRHRFAVAATVRLATTVTVSTRYMQRLARDRGWTPHVIPLGVDAARFAPAVTPPTPPWRLLHVASLNAVKDQRTLLAAFRLVSDRCPGVHLDVVGEDTLGGAIQRRARELSLDATVTFHGFQPIDRVASLYRRAHLVVLSSRHEAASAAVLEAAAAGVATVGTAVGYVADFDPDRALAVPPEDPVALADGIIALLTDSARRDAIARAARAWSLAHDATWTTTQFEALYRSLRR